MPAAKKKTNIGAVKRGADFATLPTISKRNRSMRSEVGSEKEFNTGYISGKKDIAAAKRKKAAKGEFAGVVAKNAARAAKRPGSKSAPARSGVNASGYNTAFVAAKKDMAAFKRGQAKKKK